MQRFEKQSSTSSEVLLQEWAGSGVASTSSEGPTPPSHPPLPPSPAQSSHCVLLSFSPAPPLAGPRAGPRHHLIQSRSVGIGLVSCEVFLRVALLQSRLGAQDLQESGRTRFPGIPGSCPRPSQPVTPRATALGGANCPAQGHPAQTRAGSRPPTCQATGVLYSTTPRHPIN